MSSLDSGDQKISAPLGVSEPSGPNLLSRIGRWWGRKGEADATSAPLRDADAAPLPAREARRQREQLRLCLDARLTDSNANAAAQSWQAWY